jgi:hypothetical protein
MSSSRGKTSESLSEIYRRLTRAEDPDAVHAVIARKGAEILERGFPYALIAARWHRASEARAAARRESSLREAGESLAGLPPLDPFEACALDAASRELLVALAELSEVDAWIVWRFAEGLSDREIHGELVELELEVPAPGLAAIRKRRERARRWLRQRLAQRGITSAG